MSLKLSCPYEKFLVGVDVLATSDAPLRDRVEDSWMSFHTISSDDFEGDLRTKHMALDHALTHRGPVMDGDGQPKIGSVHNTISQATDQEIVDITDMIFSLFVNISREYHSTKGSF